MQGLFRNPLADPGLIGISSGATLGASLAIVLGQTLISNAVIQPWLTPLSAFVFASIVTLIVYRLATREGQTNVATLLLAGVAIQAITLSGVGLLTYMADDTQLRDMTFWSMGSLGGAQWQTLMITALFFVPAIAVLFKQASGLNAMLLGEAEARHIGVSVEQLKIMIILFSTLLVGVLVAASGLIGFIGLVVPHLVRLLIGADHRYLLPASALLGASLLVLADTAARTLVSPAELPIGILTALIGGPFFVYLLLQQRQRAWL
jgi:iron complex transport system permease protein